MLNSVMYTLKSSQKFSKTVNSGNVPDILKYADITPVFQKGDTTGKSNHRPISTFSDFSKNI